MAGHTFPSQFPPDATFYERTFTEEEKEGAIIVALHAFRNAWLRRKFSFEETEADYKETWLRETNSVYAFVQDLLSGELVESLGLRAIKDEASAAEASNLYEAYVRYCDLAGREAVTKRAFTIQMERQGYRRVLRKGRPYYKGIKIEKVKAEKVEQGGQGTLQDWGSLGFIRSCINGGSAKRVLTSPLSYYS